MTFDEKQVEHEGVNETEDVAAETVQPDEVEICEPEQAENSELDELNDRYLRMLAEFDNFRKRTAREKASMYDDGVVDAITNILPVIDNLRRALDSDPNQDDSLYKGVDMILKQLMKTLGDMGIEEIAAHGQPFDPNYHFAVAHTQDSEHSENTVTEELQKGYKYKDKVLRHSMVKVAN